MLLIDTYLDKSKIHGVGVFAKENVKKGEKIKEVSAEESSSEISISTVIIDNGGQFNQTSLSNAIKKACETLILELEKS